MSSSTSTTSLPPDSIDNALQVSAAPAEWPIPLPVVHVTVARWFDSIVKVGQLEPRLCSVFGQPLLYLFYGGAFYRPSDVISNNAADLPLAFLFEPTVLTEIARHYPFDTGALVSGKLGSYGARLQPFLNLLQITGSDVYSPARAVHHLFGSNENYVHGVLDPGCASKASPFPEIFQLLDQDLTKLGTDHRLRCIECQSTAAIDLGKHLAWIAFPQAHWPTFAKLVHTKTTPRVPQIYSYDSNAIFNPNEITYDIQRKALAFMQPYLKLV